MFPDYSVLNMFPRVSSQTNDLDIHGFASSMFLIRRGGVPSIGSPQEMLDSYTLSLRMSSLRIDRAVPRVPRGMNVTVAGG